MHKATKHVRVDWNATTQSSRRCLSFLSFILLFFSRFQLHCFCFCRGGVVFFDFLSIEPFFRFFFPDDLFLLSTLCRLRFDFHLISLYVVSDFSISIFSDVFLMFCEPFFYTYDTNMCIQGSHTFVFEAAFSDQIT